MSFADFSRYLDDDTLPLRGVPSSRYPDGKTYSAPAPDAALGLRVAAMANAGIRAANPDLTDEQRAELTDGLTLDDESETDIYAKLLGSAWEEMVADGVSWPRLQLLGKYALIYYGMGPDQADAALESGALTGKAAPPNRSARRAAGKTGSSAAGRKTPPRGSTGSTKTRKAVAAARIR